MNRPNLPFAISSVPAADLTFAHFDATSFQSTLDMVLAAYDHRAAAAEITLVVTDQPISARSHVNRTRDASFATRLLASA